MLSAQRPGGAAIDLTTVPDWTKPDMGLSVSVPTEIQALYQRSGETWVAVHYAFGATDVWFAWDPLCREYHSVIADYCG